MKLVLHIGPSKTGSTSIQAFLRVKENQLKKEGIWPLSLTQMNMSELTWIFAKKFGDIDKGNRLGINSKNLEQRRNKFKSELSEKMHLARAGGAKRLIISSESLSNLGIGLNYEQGSLNELKEFVSCFANDLTVVPVLRRQDLRSVSRYKNIVKNGGWNAKHCFIHHHTLELDRMLINWSDVFGSENIKPILFPDSVTEQRYLIKDFCTVAGFSHLFDPSEQSLFRRNSAVDGRAIEIFRQLNIKATDRHLREKNQIIKRFNSITENHFKDPIQKICLQKDDAEQFLNKYTNGNELVRKMFFPERDTLFKNDFSMFFESSYFPAPDIEDLYAILAKLLYDEPLTNLAKKKRLKRASNNE